MASKAADLNSFSCLTEEISRARHEILEALKESNSSAFVHRDIGKSTLDVSRAEVAGVA